jgi:hypothetical protein
VCCHLVSGIALSLRGLRRDHHGFWLDSHSLDRLISDAVCNGRWLDLGGSW